MARQKSSESDKSAEKAAVEKQVDAMLDPKQPSSTSTPDTKTPSQEGEPIDIFKDRPDGAPEGAVKSAPDLPSKLKRQLEDDKPETPGTATAADPETKPPLAPADEISRVSGQPLTVNEQNPELNNDDTDQAVDDIAAHDGDSLLAMEDEHAKPKSAELVKKSSSWKDRLKHIFKSKRFWVIVTILLVIVSAVPFTRYKILGLIIKRPISLVVIDSKTKTPVSNTIVSLGGTTAKTDANGHVKLQARTGTGTLRISKQYYKTFVKSYFVGLKTPQPSRVVLVATGRQVPVSIVNQITGQPLKNAEIKVLGTTAKTDAKGRAVIVLPAKTATSGATVQLSGYNSIKVNVIITNQVISQNTFKLTPAGHIYFLSNLNGSIDVVKTNLDGSSRKVILEGTGREEATTTSLLASRDWRYVVLKARRDTTQPALYLIDTSNDEVTAFEQSNSSLNLIGWYGHRFMYDLVKTAASGWQSGREVIKSYDADNTEPSQLDQSQAQGDANTYGYQSFDNFYIVGNLLAYTSQWNSFGGFDLAGKSDSTRAIQPTGQNKKDYQTFVSSDTGYLQARLYKPQAVYYAAYNNTAGKLNYYSFENQAITSLSSLNPSDFNRSYPTYLLSPSGEKTFWTELRDGKNTLFTGDTKVEAKKQITSGSDYTPYGWYSDNYVLVSKNASELYIMPANGSPKGTQPHKISNYYKPAQTYQGYGYGYGGL